MSKLNRCEWCGEITRTKPNESGVRLCGSCRAGAEALDAIVAEYLDTLALAVAEIDECPHYRAEGW